MSFWSALLTFCFSYLQNNDDHDEEIQKGIEESHFSSDGLEDQGKKDKESELNTENSTNENEEDSILHSVKQHQSKQHNHTIMMPKNMEAEVFINNSSKPVKSLVTEQANQ